jgi:predicted nucleic acid-binding protein
MKAVFDTNILIDHLLQESGFLIVGEEFRSGKKSPS